MDDGNWLPPDASLSQRAGVKAYITALKVAAIPFRLAFGVAQMVMRDTRTGAQVGASQLHRIASHRTGTPRPRPLLTRFSHRRMASQFAYR